ncbi:MAG: reverse transcriptase domain-containing protein, partial [Paraclostridium sp.]|uniref:reverse transcriptase domain-containing protein n=1 Tax=Paraclostridium sp. TaxID=2023273 RepID=UPI003F2E98EE
MLTGIILHRLTGPRENQIRENQAGFRPGRGCIDHIFTLRQLLELRHTFRQPTIVVFLDLKTAFDSVDRSALWCSLLTKGVPRKSVSLLQSL